MELLDTATMDDLLDFSIGEQEEDDDEIYNHNHPCEKTKKPSLHNFSSFTLLPSSSDSPPFSDYVEEEELEWISNKDAFPMVESFVDIIPNHPSIAGSSGSHSHLSPVSVLENSNGSSMNFHSGGSGRNHPVRLINTSLFKVPGKARSKHVQKRRRDMLGEQWKFLQEKAKPKPKPSYVSGASAAGCGRKCLHCGSDKTPQWRAGPLGPKTLCNACGVRYKSGRLVPEYRPANSPTFREELHSNSHRKIVEMRRQKMGDAGYIPGAADIVRIGT